MNVSGCLEKGDRELRRPFSGQTQGGQAATRCGGQTQGEQAATRCGGQTQGGQAATGQKECFGKRAKLKVLWKGCLKICTKKNARSTYALEF